jgi:hypothetical protein
MASAPSSVAMDEKSKAMYNVETFMAQFKRAEQEHSPSLPGGDPTTYAYIPKLLMHPVRDGRMRLLWLVIAPYFVNILKLPLDQAEKYCQEYFEECHQLEPCSNVLASISMHIGRVAPGGATERGLMPPRLETLEISDPDLYDIIRRAIGDS